MNPSPVVVQVVCTDAFAGIERYVSTLANGLSQRAWRVIVLGGERRRMSKELSANVEAWHPARGTIEAFMRLTILRQVDIVHAHMTHAELAAALARPFTRARLVVTRHFPAPRGSTSPGRVASVAIRRALDLQLACSQYVAARVDGPSTVVWPGVVSDDAAPEMKREPIVLLLQRLEPEKDSLTALWAWASSGLAERGWSLHVVGDGSERPHLERVAADLSISNSCRFLGATDDIGPHLATASILIAPGRCDAFGLSVVEAMAVGLPVVAAAAGGHVENVGAYKDAALFAPGDADEAARLLVDLAESEPRRRGYGSALRSLQRERFTADRLVAETLAQYRTVMER